ncbi:MAG: flagellar motor switch protein FliG [Gemmatimonadetes bacterium]|nr:MAG: flagellar motor switch protein FliG [Gemmatimonadota bacterium]
MATALAKREAPALEELTGRQKTAILLMALGEEASAEVTRNLSPDEVEAISFEIARMDKVDPEVVEHVLEEWQHTERAAFSLASGGVDFARRVLEKAFGPAKAQTLLKRIEAQLHDHISLAHLRNADPQQLTAMIRNEHPQIMALTMAYLDPAQTATIIRELDPGLRPDIILRIARMEKVMPDVLKIVQESFGDEADLSMTGDGTTAGGPEAVAEVLNLVASGLEKELLEGVAEEDPELSEQIKNLMFVFEDIQKLDDKGITRLLRDVETRELALALKMASEELKDRILGTLSSRARDALVEEMEFLGPQRVSDVEAAQANIVKMARALEEAGEIVIGGSDDMVIE